MKVTEISWARTYNQNYQSYRASASAKLEDWETDIDACYDNLKEIVREQIGKQCSDYKGFESDEVLSLREMTEKLRNDRAHLRKTLRQTKFAVNEEKSRLENLSYSLQHKGLPMLKQLIAILASNGLTEEDDARLEGLLMMQNSLENLDLESLSVDSNNDYENENNAYEDEDEENEDDDDDDDSLIPM